MISLIILYAVIGGIFISILYVNPCNGLITLTELVLQLSGSRGELALGHSMSELVSFAMRLLPSWLFEAYAGITIYKHFCTASVYVFSRCTNRIKWYMKEILLLTCRVLAFEMTLLVATIIVTSFRYVIQVDSRGIYLLVCHFLIQSMWIYIFTVFTNILSLVIGSSMSYGCTIALQAICISMLGIKEIVEYPILIRINPISHMVLGWHSNNIENISLQFINFHYDFHMSETMRIYALGCVIVTVVAGWIINKYDFMILDSEVGAI